MMKTSTLAMLVSAMLVSAAAGTASAATATVESSYANPQLPVQLFKRGADDGVPGCDDHGSDLCAIAGNQVA